MSAVERDLCRHEVCTLVDRADLGKGTRCDACGLVMSVDSIPLADAFQVVKDYETWAISEEMTLVEIGEWLKDREANGFAVSVTVRQHTMGDDDNE